MGVSASSWKGCCNNCSAVHRSLASRKSRARAGIPAARCHNQYETSLLQHLLVSSLAMAALRSPSSIIVHPSDQTSDSGLGRSPLATSGVIHSGVPPPSYAHLPWKPSSSHRNP
ncbi:unnamed protein product [Musa acuminata var. zebrina]